MYNQVPKVSIIVPVYNAEKYIHKCLDSIKNQTFCDWECILVDDGSTDASGAICNEYAAVDDRFRVFHKENGGVSSARQKGYDESKGEYLIHVDPDDWVEDNMLQKLYMFAHDNDADIVLCDYFLDTTNKSKYVSQKPVSLLSTEIMQQIILQRLHGSLWNKFVRRECCIKYMAYFPSNLTIWEDQFFWYCILPHKVTVLYLPQAFYHYDRSVNCNSLVASHSVKTFESMKWMIDYLKNCNCIQLENLFFMKKSAKTLAFLSGRDKKTIVDLYKEINHRFLEETEFSKSQPTVNAIRLILIGYSLYFVRMYYWIHIRALKMKRTLFN